MNYYYFIPLLLAAILIVLYIEAQRTRSWVHRTVCPPLATTITPVCTPTPVCATCPEPPPPPVCPLCPTCTETPQCATCPVCATCPEPVPCAVCPACVAAPPCAPCPISICCQPSAAAAMVKVNAVASDTTLLRATMIALGLKTYMDICAFVHLFGPQPPPAIPPTDHVCVLVVALLMAAEPKCVTQIDRFRASYGVAITELDGRMGGAVFPYSVAMKDVVTRAAAAVPPQ